MAGTLQMCLGDYSKFGAGRSCQVLLVGGDKAYQEELAVGLELLGLSIVTATSAGDALAIVTQNDHVGVVITDIRVPGMSDLELATRILSARHTEQSVEVIILANYIAHRVRQEAKRLGILRAWIYRVPSRASPWRSMRRWQTSESLDRVRFFVP